MSLDEVVFKSHNIDTYQLVDSVIINLCSRKFELLTVCKESVTISDLKSVSLITEIFKSVDSTVLIVFIAIYVFAIIRHSNSFYFFDPCYISC